MYNIIHYDKIKELEPITQTVEKYIFNEETGYDTLTEVTETIIPVQRIPSRFVFHTATNADNFLAHMINLEEFYGHMPSLNSAVNMFEASGVTKVCGESGGAAEFPSLNCANGMFRNCYNLISVDINLPSLTQAEEIFDGCVELTTFTGSLNSLENATGMFKDCSKLSVFDANLDKLSNATEMFFNTGITDFEIQVPSLSDATSMFELSTINLFSSKTPKLICANRMFNECDSLLSISIEAELLESAAELCMGSEKIQSASIIAPNLKDATDAFNGCTALESFSGSTNSLQRASRMFKGTKIKGFLNVLDNLVEGIEMFKNTELQVWNNDMPRLVDGSNMFNNIITVDGIETTGNMALAYFKGNLSSLRQGDGMFKGNRLVAFNSGLPNLSSGVDMFSGAALDPLSCMYIAESISALGGEITIGIDCLNAEDALNEFAARTGVYDTFAEILAVFDAKNWIVTWEYNSLSKYSACTTADEMAAINPDYKNDLISGAWKYDLSNFGSTGSYGFAFQGSIMRSCELNMPVTKGVCYMYIDCLHLTTAKLNAPEAINSGYTFANCSNLTSAEVYVPKSTCSECMFENCTNLTSFVGDLSTVYCATDMFKGCKLDVASVKNIAATLGDVTSVAEDGITRHITIGIDANYEGNSEVNDTLNAITAKGWTVVTEYNGTDASNDEDA